MSCLMAVMGLPVAHAQQTAASERAREQLSTQLNANTVSIVSGNLNGTYLKIAYDISAVLDDGNNLRVLPIIGKGGAQNIMDVLYLKGVDMGIAPSDVLKFIKEQGGAGKNVETSIRYITKLYNEEMHLLAQPDAKDLQDLDGKTVNFSDAGSATQLTARSLFKTLNLKVKEVNMGQADAIEKMKSGEIAATFLVSGKPAPIFADFKAGDRGFHFLPLRYNVSMAQDYFPARLTAKDYPALIPPDGEIETMAASVILIAYNWPEGSERYNRVAKFVDAFYSKIGKFQEAPRHPKWTELNFATDVVGWKRFTRVQQILDRDKHDDLANVKSEFQTFLRQMSESRGVSPKSQAEEDALFQQFQSWSLAKRQNASTQLKGATR